MGLYSSAELIWGVPVLAYDEDGEPTQFWDPDKEDWASVPAPLEIESYGHYEDPDNERAILTHSAIPRFRGDCWTPTPVGDRDLDVEAYYQDALDEFVAAVVALDESLLNERGWYLVASFG